MYLLDEGDGDEIPGHNSMVHQLQEGSESEGQHLPKAQGKRTFKEIFKEKPTWNKLQHLITNDTIKPFLSKAWMSHFRNKIRPHWVPLSTRRARVPMPSMLMYSAAKVGSADSLASSFRASRRASMLWDWILSRSWRAARACWESKSITVWMRFTFALTRHCKKLNPRSVNSHLL